MSCAASRQERTFSSHFAYELKKFAEIFGYALERERSVAEIHSLQSEVSHLSKVTVMGQFAASIAHELNQPLAAIVSNAQAIRTLVVYGRPSF